MTPCGTAEWNQTPWDLRIKWTGCIPENQNLYGIIAGENLHAISITSRDVPNYMLRCDLRTFAKPNLIQDSANLCGLSLWVQANTKADKQVLFSFEVKSSVAKASEELKYISRLPILFNLEEAKRGFCLIPEFAILSIYNFKEFKTTSRYLNDSVYISTFIRVNVLSIGVDLERPLPTHPQTGHLLQNFKALLATGNNFSDIKIKSKDNLDIAIPAHRFILAARSPYLQRLLEAGAKEFSNGNTELIIPEINANALNVLLQWMYTEEIPKHVGMDVVELLDGAALLEMKDFPESLDKQFGGLCNTENMFQLAAVAKKYSMCTALQDISKFIKENIDRYAQL